MRTCVNCFFVIISSICAEINVIDFHKFLAFAKFFVIFTSDFSTARLRLTATLKIRGKDFLLCQTIDSYCKMRDHLHASLNVDPVSIQVSLYRGARYLLSDVMKRFLHTETTSLSLTLNAISYWMYWKCFDFAVQISPGRAAMILELQLRATNWNLSRKWVKYPLYSV